MQSRFRRTRMRGKPRGAAVSNATAKEATALPLDGVRALVVDDSAINRDILRRLLESHGAIVTGCPDGAAAVEHVRDRRRRCDIVLMDIQMPVLDGNEATQCIRRDTWLRALPIIGVTGGALPCDRKRSLDAGMNEIIAKPFDTPNLIRRVRTLVGLARERG